MSIRRVVREASVSIAIALALVIGTGNDVSAQIAIGLRVGKAAGTANYDIGEVTVRARAWGPVHGHAAFEVIGGTWACPASPIADVGCGYDGYSLSVGPTIAALDGDRLFVALRTALGAFVRTGTGGVAGHEESGNLTGSVGLDGEVSIAGPFRLQVGVTHRRIFDSRYDRVVGGFPNYTALSAGVSFVFGHRR